MGRYVSSVVTAEAKAYGSGDYSYRCVYNTPGSYTFTVPSGVTQVKAIAVGGGSPGSTGSVYSHAEMTRCLPLNMSFGSEACCDAYQWRCTCMCIYPDDNHMNLNCSISGELCYSRYFNYKEYAYAYTGSGGGYAEKNISVTPGENVCVTVGGQGQTSSFGAYISATGASAPVAVRTAPTVCMLGFCPCFTPCCVTTNTFINNRCWYISIAGCLGSLCDYVQLGCPVTGLTFAPGVGCNGDKNYTGGCGSFLLSPSLQGRVVNQVSICDPSSTYGSCCCGFVRYLSSIYCIWGTGDCAWSIGNKHETCYNECITKASVCCSNIACNCMCANHVYGIYGQCCYSDSALNFGCNAYSGSSSGSPLGDGKPGAIGAINKTVSLLGCVTSPSADTGCTITCDQQSGICCVWYRFSGCCFPGNAYRQHVIGKYCLLCTLVKQQKAYSWGGACCYGVCISPCYYNFACLPYGQCQACSAQLNWICDSHVHQVCGCSISIFCEACACQSGFFCGDKTTACSSWPCFLNGDLCNYTQSCCTPPWDCLAWKCIAQEFLLAPSVTCLASLYPAATITGSWSTTAACCALRMMCTMWACNTCSTCLCRTQCGGSICCAIRRFGWCTHFGNEWFYCCSGQMPQYLCLCCNYTQFTVSTCLPKTFIAPGSAGGPNSCGNPGCMSVSNPKMLISGVGADPYGYNPPNYIDGLGTKTLSKEIADCINSSYQGDFHAWYMCNVWWNSACCNCQRFNPCTYQSCIVGCCGGQWCICACTGPVYFAQCMHSMARCWYCTSCEYSPCTDCWWTMVLSTAYQWLKCNTGGIYSAPYMNPITGCECTCCCSMDVGCQGGMFINSYSKNWSGTPTCLVTSSPSYTQHCIYLYDGTVWELCRTFAKAACVCSCWLPCCQGIGYCTSCRFPTAIGYFCLKDPMCVRQTPVSGVPYNAPTFNGNSNADPYLFKQCDAVGAQGSMCIINTCTQILPSPAYGGGGCAGCVVCGCCIQPITNAPYNGGIFPCGTPGFGGGGTVMGSGGTGLVVVYWN